MDTLHPLNLEEWGKDETCFESYASNMASLLIFKGTQPKLKMLSEA